MTDEARIARLTQLARRVWPRRDPEAVEHEWHDGFPGFEVLSGDHDLMANDEDSNTVLAFVQSHPRALDALEAALLVLAGDVVLTGDERNLMRPDVQRIVQANVDVGMAYTDLLLGVEQLAAEWEVKARMIAERCISRLPKSNYVGPLSDIITNLIDGLARELRERAKRGSE